MDGNPSAPAPQEYLPKDPRRGRSGLWILTVVLTLVAGFGLGAWMTARAPRACAQSRAQAAPVIPLTPHAPPPATAPAVPSGAPGSFADLAEQVAPSVTNIVVSKTVKGMSFRMPSPFGPGEPFGEFFKQFQVPQAPQRQRGQGSGVIISSDGYILTNNHVVDDADEITVRLSDKRELKGKVVGRDPKTDLALVKVDSGKPLPAVKLGNSDKARVGDWVVAVGNPFGLDHTVTAGIISAKGRALEGPYDDFIQTDASINPGNSGGPLLNLQGEVIGINAQIVAGGQGIGFAIPVNLAKSIVEQLKTKGGVSRGWLGVAIQDLTPEMAGHFGLQGKQGALVADVTAGGPADEAGLQHGDVIVSFNGKPIQESHDLPLLVANTPIGRKVEVKILREGSPKTFTVKVGRLAEEQVAREDKGESSEARLGLSVQDLTPEIASGLGIQSRQGVVVAEVTPGSPADDAGIHRGDVVREVDQKPVKNAAEFVSAVRGERKDGSVLLLVEREGQHVFIAVKTAAKSRG